MGSVEVPEDPIAAARRAYLELNGRDPAGVAFAPGRVNLIGEHTDYNDGFVLPMAVQHGVAAAFGRRRDRRLRVQAADVATPGETWEIGLDDLDRARGGQAGWFRYAAGAAWAMKRAGLALRGADIATASSLPVGAGLSSSAAFTIAIARALAAVSQLTWQPAQAARMAQQAEQEFAGVACGIMDQVAIVCAEAGTALLLDCRTLTFRQVPLPQDVRVVLMDSGVRRSLATSAYNDRRAACERATAAIRAIAPQVRALRDVDERLLARARPLMDATAFRRASHVVAENLRPLQFAAALAAGDRALAGSLMSDSHASLRDLYEVSSHELDLLVALASAQPGCHGARLTGAGFGGFAVALVEAAAVEPFAAAVAQAYLPAAGRSTDITVARPSPGARLVDSLLTGS